MIQTRNTDLVNLREILRVHPHILLPALTKLLVILDTQAPVHYLNIWFAVRKNTGYVPNGRNLSQLCNAFLRYGVLFFAQIRKRTTFNWVSSGGPIGVGTLQGSYKKRHFEGSVLRQSREQTTIIATTNTSVFELSGDIVWTTQRDYSPRANMVSANDLQSVSLLLYENSAEHSFFKNYKDELLFLTSTSDCVSIHQPLTTQKGISKSHYTLRKFNLEKLTTDAAHIAAPRSRNCSKTRSRPQNRTRSRPEDRTGSAVSNGERGHQD